MANKAMDLFLIYEFLKRLVQPFEKWEAYKLGVIDKDGKVLIDKNDRDSKQKKAWGYYDRLVANLKKLLAKVPGGKRRIASFAAALLLLREHNIDPDDTLYLEECLNFYMGEAQTLHEELTNVAGQGAIAGIGVGKDGEPGVYPKDIRDRKKKNKQIYRQIIKSIRMKK